MADLATLQAELAAAQAQLAAQKQTAQADLATTKADQASLASLQLQMTAAEAKLTADSAILDSDIAAITVTNATIASLNQQIAALSMPGNMPDMAHVLALIDTTRPTSTVIKSGNLSDPTVLDKPLIAGNSLHVPAGFSLTPDVSTPRCWQFICEGTLLAPPTGQVTWWFNDYICNEATIAIGTPTQACEGQLTFMVADYGPIDTTRDPYMLGRGVHFINCNVGIYGCQVTDRAFTNGSKKGDTSVTLLQPVVGWTAPGTFLMPGVKTCGINDDDEGTFTAVSADGFTLTLAAPLQNDHPIINRFGETRPMAVVNTSRRCFNIESENKTTTLQRGHFMIMNDRTMTGPMAPTFHCEYASFYELGRTNKLINVTDPDGMGGGLGNVRGRYAVHCHMCGPDRSNPDGTPRPFIEFIGCYVHGSPGLGYVNHDSRVCWENCVGTHVVAETFFEETGSGTTMARNLTSMRNMAPYNQNRPDNQFANADFGHDGSAFWFHGGGVTMDGVNLAFGCQNSVLVMLNLDFTLNGVTAMFDAKNLLPGQVYTDPTTGVISSGPIRASYVPFSISGIQGQGNADGLNIWGNGGTFDMVPRVAPSIIRDCAIDVNGRVRHHQYLSNVTEINIHGCKIVNPQLGDDYAGVAFDHSGFSTNIVSQNCSAKGFNLGMQSPTNGTNVIDGFTDKCLVGIWAGNSLNQGAGDFRKLTITNRNQIPLTASDIAYILTTYYWGHPDFVASKQQLNVELRCNQGGTELTGLSLLDFLSGRDCQQSDTITLDGKFLYFPEMAPTYPLGSIDKNVPAALVGMDGAQILAKYGLAVGVKTIPADAVPLAGSQCLWSVSPAVNLPFPKLPITVS